MSTKFCPQCGIGLSVQAVFCSTCGFKTSASNQIPPNQTYLVQPTQPTQSDQHTQSYATQRITYQQPAQSTVQHQVEVPIEQPAQPTSPLPEGSKYAEFGDRFLAFIIDMIIISAITGIISFMMWERGGWGIVEFLVGLIYFWVCESNEGKGQTLGKKAMNLRTVDEKTLGAITPKQAFLHVIGKVLFVFLDVFIGLITHDQDKNNPNVVDNQQIRISQRFSHTVVVKLPKA
jgi:uncharacterized RDD family membrane protein YckC